MTHKTVFTWCFANLSAKTHPKCKIWVYLKKFRKLKCEVKCRKNALSIFNFGQEIALCLYLLLPLQCLREPDWSAPLRPEDEAQGVAAVAGAVRGGAGGLLPQHRRPRHLLQGKDQPRARRQHHAGVISTLELQTNLRENFMILEKAHTSPD